LLGVELKKTGLVAERSGAAPTGYATTVQLSSPSPRSKIRSGCARRPTRRQLFHAFAELHRVVPEAVPLTARMRSRIL
jgi:hypothetical protein